MGEYMEECADSAIEAGLRLEEQEFEDAEKQVFDPPILSVADMNMKIARGYIKKFMIDDPELAWGWHCNIAMPIMDSLNVSPLEANKTAAILMKHLFEVDTSKSEHFPNEKD